MWRSENLGAQSPKTTQAAGGDEQGADKQAAGAPENFVTYVSYFSKKNETLNV